MPVRVCTLNIKMSLEPDPATLALAARCTAAIVAKAFVTYGKQGMAKVKAGNRPPEDGALFPKDGKASKQDFGLEVSTDQRVLERKMEAERWNRIVGNDLECIPFGLIAMWGASIVCKKDSKVLRPSMLLFTISRILYTLMYANARQPWRAMSWFGGWIGVGGMLSASVAATSRL